jgi:hypothetical protein
MDYDSELDGSQQASSHSQHGVSDQVDGGERELIKSEVSQLSEALQATTFLPKPSAINQRDQQIIDEMDYDYVSKSTQNNPL